MSKVEKVVLALEDGSVFEGKLIGAGGECVGEVALNTAVVGYQEMLSDPANAGKILILTYPLIGNYGVADKFYESSKCWAAGLVIKESSRIYSNWQAGGPFEDFLKREKITAISGVDTRTLAVRIRDKGEMLGIISASGNGTAGLISKLRDYKKDPKADFISKISVKAIKEMKGGKGPRVAVLDIGMLRSFIKQLQTLGCDVTLLPYDTTPEKILSLKPDGLIISNGPEGDYSLPRVAKTIERLLGTIPIMGISTGHEAIAMALGARLKRMRLGHRGVNYPVKSADSLHGEITVQNHAFVVEEGSLKSNKDVRVTLRNLNDNSIEEMESEKRQFISTQYYPASPGFDEVNDAFLRFLTLIKTGKTSTRRSVHGKTKEVEHAKA